MVSTAHSTSTAYANARRPRGAETPGRHRSLRRPSETDRRPAWYARTVGSAAIGLGSCIALARVVGDHSAARIAVDVGLVCVGLAAAPASAQKLRRAGLLVSALAGVVAIGITFAHPTNAGLLLACLGFGIALDRLDAPRARWLAHGLVIAAAALAAYSLIRRSFGSTVPYPIISGESMSIATAVAGLLLAIGAMLLQTDVGLGALFSSNTSGGVLTRRLMPALVVLLIGTVRLAYWGVQVDAYDASDATSFGAWIGVAIVILMVAASARALDRVDTVRRGNEAQIRQMVVDIARQSKELTRSNQELESFSYSVSHDLRAPIRHIAGFTELLATTSAGRLDDKAKHYVSMIQESAEQAGKLIDDLLEFSRMGRREINFRDVALDEVVRDAWTKLLPERAGRAIELRASALPTVSADPALLEVAIGNLLSNAIKYTAHRHDAVIDVGAREDGEDVELVVSDNGAGFDMKYVDKLFGVFQRLHGDEFEGVGIGLANVKRIVERHNGRVWAEGEVDRGASFHISLPRAKDVSA
jgi:signal transduction histidine kinase